MSVLTFHAVIPEETYDILALTYGSDYDLIQYKLRVDIVDNL